MIWVFVAAVPLFGCLLALVFVIIGNRVGRAASTDIEKIWREAETKKAKLDDDKTPPRERTAEEIRRGLQAEIDRARRPRK